MSRLARLAVLALLLLAAAFAISLVVSRGCESPAEILRKNSNIRVEVLNGCGVDRLALRVTDILRERGFNVVRVGSTSPDFFEECVVIERRDDDARNARYFARRVNCRNVGKDLDPALYLEVTLILGKDYATLFPEVDEKP